jgi:hypothetical protein
MNMPTPIAEPPFDPLESDLAYAADHEDSRTLGRRARGHITDGSPSAFHDDLINRTIHAQIKAARYAAKAVQEMASADRRPLLQLEAENVLNAIARMEAAR